MSMQEWLDSELTGVADELAGAIRNSPGGDNSERFSVPRRQATFEALQVLLSVLLPESSGRREERQGSTGGADEKLRAAAKILLPQVEQAFEHMCPTRCSDDCDCRRMAFEAVTHLVRSLPDVRKMLGTDVQAAYEGDPAALSVAEVVMSYPFVEAIAVHRIAHELYEKKVPVIPRVMSEWAHSRTGIDVHPGARIGTHFFIDHGTGVVIGETTTIGDRVKLYQGVTLGAMSFPLDEDGKPVKGVKRHPDIGDDVTIYAGATILGGGTAVGRGSVIGGNVWLTRSVPPYSIVNNAQPEPRVVNQKASLCRVVRTAEGPDRPGEPADGARDRGLQTSEE